ncbi:MAG TPA: hypothetical protein VJP89_20190, partial [Pyrinomonadaceae bacterium]|nr:hypothetical protein [Pyrinomonadaceae bacterium]
TFANRIAQAAVPADAIQMVRLLRVSGFFGGPVSDTGNTSNGHNVGIWEPKAANGKVAFVRRMEAMAEWTYWADVARIEPKGEKLRVLFIGESVARGYLYDPVFNPAMALQMVLDAQLGEGKAEVIDLARTNLGFQILDVAINALQMEPDMAIVFAGNNWYISEPSPSEVAEFDEAIAKHGIGSAKDVIDNQLARTSKHIVNQICSAYASKGVPVAWMIPEFNLRDWQDPLTSAPYLSVDLNKQWFELHDEAQSAFRDQDFARAANLAEQMIEIDRGLCVAGYYILAACSSKRNDVEAERKYLTLARDATSWDLSKTIVPRPYSVMQDAVREEATKHNVQLIDLPALFREHLKGGIPDRRLFLDYCHLTTEGIQVSMAAAASSVLQALKGIARPWYTLVDYRVAPSPEMEAEASFLAAIINAHCAQSYELVHYFCTRALNYSRSVSRWMLDYIELQTQSSVPTRMSETEEKMWREGSPLIRNLLRLNKKRLHRLLLKAIVSALEEAGIQARERVERLCIEEHSVTRNAADLLDFYYSCYATQSREIAWLNSADMRYRPDAEYYRAYWPESMFVFVGEAGCAVRLSLTCRLPKPKREAAAGIYLNGQPQLRITIDSDWSTWDITLPGDAVHSGLNEIAIGWPMPEFVAGEALEKARLKLIEGKFPDFFPIFGEIHSFTASDGREVSTSSPKLQVESSLLEVA